MLFRIRTHVLTLLSAFVLLSGCTAALFEMDAASLGIFLNDDVNLREKNFAAADYLIHQAYTFIVGNDFIKVTPLIDAQQPELRAEIGKLIPEQVGVRLAQLGYSIDLNDVTIAAETKYLRPAQSKPDFILSGTYRRRGQELDIGMRITKVSNSRIVAVFDYSIPINREIADLSQPRPQIFKIEK